MSMSTETRSGGVLKGLLGLLMLSAWAFAGSQFLGLQGARAALKQVRSELQSSEARWTLEATSLEDEVNGVPG